MIGEAFDLACSGEQAVTEASELVPARTILHHATTAKFDGIAIRGPFGSDPRRNPIWFSFDADHARQHAEMKAGGETVRILTFETVRDLHLVDAERDHEIIEGYDDDIPPAEVASGVLARGVDGWTDGHEVMIGDPTAIRFLSEI